MTQNGIKLETLNIEALKRIPSQINNTVLTGFLGFAYFRKFARGTQLNRNHSTTLQRRRQSGTRHLSMKFYVTRKKLSVVHFTIYVQEYWLGR